MAHSTEPDTGSHRKAVYWVIVEEKPHIDTTRKVVARSVAGALRAVRDMEPGLHRSSIRWVYWHAWASKWDEGTCDYVSEE